MKEEEWIERMQAHEVKPTAMRLLVLRTLAESNRALTLKELEDELYPADRSTIFRTLVLFQQQHLVHCIEDGSGASRYEICLSEHACSVDDQHVHFHCKQCGKTICLQNTKIPNFILPDGFLTETANCVLTGICPDCHKRGS